MSKLKSSTVAQIKNQLCWRGGKEAPLAFIRHKCCIVDIFGSGSGSARPRRSLDIKMDYAHYLYCICTFPLSKRRDTDSSWVSVGSQCRAFRKNGDERGSTDGKMRNETSTREVVKD